MGVSYNGPSVHTSVSVPTRVDKNIKIMIMMSGPKEIIFKNICKQRLGSA
jgi:hypothetical protein